MGEIFAGRYELIDPIGRGGMGAVWRSWDHRRRRYVAAKVLQQSDAHTLLRFVREQALRIDHPHVLAPASWAADDDKVLFTMDLVSGGSLAHVIGDYGPLPPRFVCTLLDQLLAGLAAVHAEGVVHRDIKPANILLEATGTGRPHLRLSDFGISMRKGEPRLTETDYVVGTPGYFAPEQMMGAEPDFPADLFAVGLVALYLLRGQKPDSRALIEHFASYGTPAAPEGIPEPLWQVVAGMLQPDPQARFRTATGARKALTAAVEMLPDASPGEDPVEVFDQIGPLPPGFGPSGPEPTPPRPTGAQGPTSPQERLQGPSSPQERLQGPSSYREHEQRPAPAHSSDPHPGPEQRQDPATSPGRHQSPAPQQSPSPHHQSPAPQQSQSPQQTAMSGPLQSPSPQQSPAMSQTGSFHLAPPPQQSTDGVSSNGPAPSSLPSTQAPSSAPPAAPSSPGPAHAAPPFPGALPGRSQALGGAVDHQLPPTRGYTSGFAEGPAPAAPTAYGSQPPQSAFAQTQAPGRAPAGQKRPGPPPKVTVPVLILALLCFAVGLWALTQT
ncbi:protein kinase [Streptomyces sp. NPDC091272]|uniref:serine/threonine-protein kinase n=1 Tax=Streptomyces sp. NPDC091272 TaxID=3365981 RepID=UPI0038175F14